MRFLLLISLLFAAPSFSYANEEFDYIVSRLRPADPPTEHERRIQHNLDHLKEVNDLDMLHAELQKQRLNKIHPTTGRTHGQIYSVFHKITKDNDFIEQKVGLRRASVGGSFMMCLITFEDIPSCIEQNKKNIDAAGFASADLHFLIDMARQARAQIMELPIESDFREFDDMKF
jgi:hypothetical protein